MSVCRLHTNLQTVNIALDRNTPARPVAGPHSPVLSQRQDPQQPHLKHQLCFLLLQLRALPLHHNAQQLVLQALRGDHTVQQGDLHAMCSSRSALCIAQVLIRETYKLDNPSASQPSQLVRKQVWLCL